MTETVVPDYRVGSVQCVYATVHDDYNTLSAQTVYLRLDGVDKPGTWLGTAGNDRVVRTTSPVTFDSSMVGYRKLDVKWVEGGETPIVDAGHIQVT